MRLNKHHTEALKQPLVANEYMIKLSKSLDQWVLVYLCDGLDEMLAELFKSVWKKFREIHQIMAKILTNETWKTPQGKPQRHLNTTKHNDPNLQDSHPPNSRMYGSESWELKGYHTSFLTKGVLWEWFMTLYSVHINDERRIKFNDDLYNMYTSKLLSRRSMYRCWCGLVMCTVQDVLGSSTLFWTIDGSRERGKSRIRKFGAVEDDLTKFRVSISHKVISTGAQIIFTRDDRLRGMDRHDSIGRSSKCL